MIQHSHENSTLGIIVPQAWRQHTHAVAGVIYDSLGLLKLIYL